MSPKPKIQENYPRLSKQSHEPGLLDIEKIKPLPEKINETLLKTLIDRAVENASIKASK